MKLCVGSKLKVVDSCRIFFWRKESDTFRSVLVHGREEETRKEYFIIVQKITFRRQIDLRNTLF